MKNNNETKPVTRAHLFARIEAFQLIPQPEPTEPEQKPEPPTDESTSPKGKE